MRVREPPWRLTTRTPRIEHTRLGVASRPVVRCVGVGALECEQDAGREQRGLHAKPTRHGSAALASPAAMPRRLCAVARAPVAGTSSRNVPMPKRGMLV